MEHSFSQYKITIIGLGLIGGSLARALRQRLNITHLIAVDRDQLSLQKAIEEKVISFGYTEISEKLWDTDILFLCTPVKYFKDYINQLSGKLKPGCIVTDVGSTKGEILEYIEKMHNPPCFIGGHPMAGSERTGYEASTDHLFENAYYILTPSKSVDKHCMDLVFAMVKAFGAIPIILDAGEHDRITASISHLPHIAAFTLVNLIRESDSIDGKMQMLAAGGFKDITRIASSSPEMWESIVVSNKIEVGNILEKYIQILEELKHRIASGDSNAIIRFFRNAKTYRDSFPTNKKSLIAPVYDIIVDIIDQPGMIGEIARLLGSNHINIKNIHVSNNREFEQGVLRITLPDLQSVGDAYELLIGKGYKVFKPN